MTRARAAQLAQTPRARARELSASAAAASRDRPPRRTPPLAGTLLGVCVPCLQNILGIILFIRLSNIVAWQGVSYAMLVVGFAPTPPLPPTPPP